MRRKVYHSFAEVYNELPPPPESIVNPPAQIQHIDEADSLGDIVDLFSYTRFRNPSSYTDDELLQTIYDKLKVGVKKAGYAMADTAKDLGRLVLESILASLIDRKEEYGEWKAATLMHPEWTEEEKSLEWDRICYEADLRKKQEEFN